eukprot:scaffold42570_cov50-Phaeocystis_antarctica.AAC.3
MGSHTGSQGAIGCVDSLSNGTAVLRSQQLRSAASSVPLAGSASLTLLHSLTYCTLPALPAPATATLRSVTQTPTLTPTGCPYPNPNPSVA